MNAQAEALNGLVRRLRLMVDGAASGAGETAPPSRWQQGRLPGASRTTSRPAPRTVPALATSGVINRNAFPLDEAFSEF